MLSVVTHIQSTVPTTARQLAICAESFSLWTDSSKEPFRTMHVTHMSCMGCALGGGGVGRRKENGWEGPQCVFMCVNTIILATPSLAQLPPTPCTSLGTLYYTVFCSSPGHRTLRFCQRRLDDYSPWALDVQRGGGGGGDGAGGSRDPGAPT